MTLKQKVQQAVANRNPRELSELMDRLRFGVRSRLGRVTFNYAEQQELFQRCVPECGPNEFEELCQLAEEADR